MSDATHPLQDEPSCPRCGYTAADKATHGDHHLCVDPHRRRRQENSMLIAALEAEVERLRRVLDEIDDIIVDDDDDLVTLRAIVRVCRHQRGAAVPLAHWPRKALSPAPPDAKVSPQDDPCGGVGYLVEDNKDNSISTRQCPVCHPPQDEWHDDPQGWTCTECNRFVPRAWVGQTPGEKPLRWLRFANPHYLWVWWKHLVLGVELASLSCDAVKAWAEDYMRAVEKDMQTPGGEG